MSEIVISLGRGPEDQPVGRVGLSSGHVMEFTGWLALIRILEDELRELPPHGTGQGQPHPPP